MRLLGVDPLVHRNGADADACTCTLNEEMVLSSKMPLVSGDVIDCWVVPHHADEEASIGTVTPSDTGYESPLVEEGWRASLIDLVQF